MSSVKSDARPATGATEASAAPAQVAKGALRRLALSKAEPTPENYARAYAEELGSAPRPVLPPRAQTMLDRLAGTLLRDEAARRELLEAFGAGNQPAFERLLEAHAEEEKAQANAQAALIERLVRGLQRNDRQWTLARKKDSLQTVLDGSRSDARKLQQRLAQLVASWDDGGAEAQPGIEAVEPSSPAAESSAAGAAAAAAPADAQPARMAADAPKFAGLETPDADWVATVGALGETIARALPAGDARSATLGEALRGLLARLADAGPTLALREGLGERAAEAERLLQRRELLLTRMRTLCEELTSGLTDLAEDDSWARGQCEAMQGVLADGLSARGVRSVSALLVATRTRQRQLRSEREQARDALKSLIHQMLQEVGELGLTTGRFHDSVGRYAAVIESADSLESLAGAVREMVAESQTVQGIVSAAQQRLQDEHAHTARLSQQVQTLEAELRRLSDEVSTDQLTQVANRRGLMSAFEVERSRVERGAAGLVLSLLDVDNFKRLNDDLGHAAGDEALKSLAERVRQLLRPSDTVARYGGEEFVVMLSDTRIEEAQAVLSRMQRAMTEALFMHESRPIFVTFSAGVTAYRPGERLEDALERADEALYDAKRTGKNRTCVA